MTRTSQPWLLTTAALILAGALLSATPASAERPTPATPTPARTGELRGIVRDPNQGMPLNDVHVFLVESTLSSISSASGGYLLASVPAGTYELRAERIGYVRVVQQVTVRKVGGLSRTTGAYVVAAL